MDIHMTRFILSIFAVAVTLVAPAPAAERIVTLAVDNMTCELCPPIVKKSLARVPGVASAEVSGEKHTATVIFDDHKTTVAALISATKNVGYPSRPVP
jgi:periplasmic mercuric ion binding protein